MLSTLEGWALGAGTPGAPGWSWRHAGLLPFEIRALAHHVRVGRVILFLLNLVIVAYLVRNVRRRRAAHRSIA